MNSCKKTNNEDKLDQFFLQTAETKHYPATKIWEQSEHH